MIEAYLKDPVYQAIVDNIEENKKLVEVAQHLKKKLYDQIIALTKEYTSDKKYSAAIALFLKDHGKSLTACLADCNASMTANTQHLPEELASQIKAFLDVTKNGFDAQMPLQRKQAELKDYQAYHQALEQLEKTLKNGQLDSSLRTAAQKVIEFVKKQRAAAKSKLDTSSTNPLSSLAEVLQKTNELLINYETAEPSFFKSYLRYADKQKGGGPNIVDFIRDPFVGQLLFCASTALSLCGAWFIGLSFLRGANPLFLHCGILSFIIAAVAALLFLTIAYFSGVFNSRTDLSAQMADVANTALNVKAKTINDYDHQKNLILSHQSDPV